MLLLFPNLTHLTQPDDHLSIISELDISYLLCYYTESSQNRRCLFCRNMFHSEMSCSVNVEHQDKHHKYFIC